MPEHTSFVSYLVAMFPALGKNMHNFGETFYQHRQVGAHDAEPIATSILLALLIIGLAFVAKGSLKKIDEAVIPDDKLTLRTIFEVYVGYWYNTMKDMMGPKRAKRYFPIVGTLSLFIIVSNLVGLVPGFIPPTSSLSVTLGCSAVVFIMFNYYGLKENGIKHITHLAGPWLGWIYLPINILLFPIELISLCIRPFSLSLRLMLNLAIDHLLVSIMMGMVVFLVPVPFMVLGTLVCFVQVAVFCLLTSIYITLATDHEDHDDAGHDHASEEGDDGDPAKDAGHAAHAHA